MASIGRVIRIGTRGSPLALAQTELVGAALSTAFPGIGIEVVKIQTKGDLILDRPLANIGDKGLFIAEIEDALRSGRIDCAVHSAKDMPSEISDDMMLIAYLKRADPRDVLLTASHEISSLEQLPKGARIGTGSPRRRCQLLAARPDLVTIDIRGNVGTRIRKMHSGDYDALILAAAGLDRLNIHDSETERIHRVSLPPDVMLPAVGQGAITIEINRNRNDLWELFAAINDEPTSLAVQIERAFLAKVDGGCHSAVAAHAEVIGNVAHVSAMVGSGDSGLMFREDVTVDAAESFDAALDSVTSLAARLVAKGGRLLANAPHGDLA